MITRVLNIVKAGGKGTTAAPGPDATIPAAVAWHAAATPGRTAVDDGASRLSFADLETRSNRLAGHLRELGAAPECCVGLFLERSAGFVVAALAVLKTGAAYLPLDPSTPPDRVAFILGDAGAALLVTHRGKADGLAPMACRVVELDGPEGARIEARRGGPAPVETSADDPAYVIYTSGSSGRPKGVEVTRANLAHLIAWHREAFHVTAADRASVVAGLGFDAAVWEIWPHLTAGASLHVADEVTRRSPQALRDWLVAEKVTIGFVPTVLAETMIQTPWPSGTALRTLLTGAEALHKRPRAGLPFVLVNNYGPTECAVVATSGVVSPDGDSTIPIGRPIRGMSALILGEDLTPVADGEAGELCLAGAGVARGYRNHPELTAARFVEYPADSNAATRVYRTGDRVRMLPGGEIAFLGRFDDQLKIRGHRVEPGEVVGWLDRCPGVEASAVVVGDGPGARGEPVLIAYVVAARGAELGASALREVLAAQLPEYMVPACFVAVDALPVTANGKLDRAALPAPGLGNVLPEGGHDSAEASGLERQVSDMVASLLGHPAIGRDENLFMAGGHSLLGAQLLTRIKETFGVRLSLRQLFGAPTVAALSAEIARAGL